MKCERGVFESVMPHLLKYGWQSECNDMNESYKWMMWTNEMNIKAEVSEKLVHRIALFYFKKYVTICCICEDLFREWQKHNLNHPCTLEAWSFALIASSFNLYVHINIKNRKFLIIFLLYMSFVFIWLNCIWAKPNICKKHTRSRKIIVTFHPNGRENWK